MKYLNRNSKMSVGLFALITCFLYCSNALALISDDTSSYPPGGWKQLCTGNSIKVIPQSTSSRNYQGNGMCWINVAADKSDASMQSWVQVPVSVSGNFNLNSKKFVESLVFNTTSGAKTVSVNGTCADDPWLTSASCSASNPYQILTVNFGWASGGLGLPPGPLSRNVFGADLVQALVNKQESQPPLAPVGLDSVRWPAGTGEVGEVKWRAGDMSGNKWVLQFDIEYANYPDATFTKVGQRVGTGPKQNMSATDANMTYVFMTPFKLQAMDYYFRVCAVNDAGRQCSSPVKARPPTQMELASVVSKIHTSAGMLGKQQQPATPPTSPVERTPTRVFGAALIAKPVVATGSGGTGTGVSGGGTSPGSAGPGSAKPDLAVAPEGMLINGRTVSWNGTNRLVLHAGPTHSCPIHVSFRYTNLGKVAANNVMADIRDSLHPVQAFANGSVPVLSQGQFANVSGITEIPTSASNHKIIFTATVREKGKIDDSNVTNNRGTITMEILCRK